MPGPPELPLAMNPADIDEPRFSSRTATLPAPAWHRLKQRAAREGVTPSSILLAAFAEVLAAWSKSPRFTLNLTLFNRLPLHPAIGDVVGDFTSLTLLEVDASGEAGLAGRARRLQERLWTDLEHRVVSGVRVLRKLARARGSGARAGFLPVVFTSTLNLGDGGDSWQALGARLIHSVTQTPQVWLDHQVFEQDGDAGLLLGLR